MVGFSLFYFACLFNRFTAKACGDLRATERCRGHTRRFTTSACSVYLLQEEANLSLTWLALLHRDEPNYNEDVCLLWVQSKTEWSSHCSQEREADHPHALFMEGLWLRMSALSFRILAGDFQMLEQCLGLCFPQMPGNWVSCDSQKLHSLLAATLPSEETAGKWCLRNPGSHYSYSFGLLRMWKLFLSTCYFICKGSLLLCSVKGRITTITENLCLGWA